MARGSGSVGGRCADGMQLRRDLRLVWRSRAGRGPIRAIRLMFGQGLVGKATEAWVIRLVNHIVL